MDIILDKVSKRYHGDWLFKDLSHQFCSPNSYAITGPNGSGKTTLLKIILGIIPCTSGNVTYNQNHIPIDTDLIYRYITFVAPYMEVPEDLTLREFYQFHFNLKPAADKIPTEQIAKESGLAHALDNPIHTFSSGMKQRVKLSLGVFSDTPILLLDEPTTNLDESGMAWYWDEINRVKSNKLLVISSNQKTEYKFCDGIIRLGPE